MIQDPKHTHWQHCPRHSPAWASWCLTQRRINFIFHTAHNARLETRGVPHRPGP